jgi:hypothetical protein
MLAIVRVTRRQLDELRMRIAPENRRYLQDITILHLYVNSGNILYFCDEDTEFFQFPAGEELSISKTYELMVTERIRREDEVKRER